MEESVHDEKPFRPRASPFYGILEKAIVHRHACILEFRTEAGTMQELRARVMDIYTDQGVEYVRLETHQVLPVEQIVRVDMPEEFIGPSDDRPENASQNGTPS